MRPTPALHLLASVSLSLFSLLASADTSYYRWNDREGNHYYGDSPPAGARNPRPVNLTASPVSYRVEKVIDGDTITVQRLGKVRLLGINTPEIAHRDRAAEPFGDKAHQRLQQLLEGKKVYLKFDQRRRDRFQRTLAHVTLEDGTAINEILLHEGLARALFLQPNMHLLRRYYQIEAGAMAARRGIWSLPEFQIRPTSDSKKCIKRFCQLRGKIRKVVHKRHYSYLHFSHKLLVAIPNDYLPQFHAGGIDINKLNGKELTVRGWVGKRKDNPYLKLEHPLQIKVTPP